jgi:prepilin peptidase CpaA
MDVSFALASSFVALIVFVGLLVWAGVGDVRAFRIPNQLNLIIAGTFLVLCVPMGMGWGNILGHLKVGLITIVITMAMFLGGLFGGGDAKMTGAVALWLGPAAIYPFIVYAAFAGGVLCLVLIVGRMIAKRYGLPKSPKWARRNLRRRAGAPYGVALAAGAILAAPMAVWFPSTIFS